MTMWVGEEGRRPDPLDASTCRKGGGALSEGTARSGQSSSCCAPEARGGQLLGSVPGVTQWGPGDKATLAVRRLLPDFKGCRTDGQ